jgi:hypothetical protein
VTHHRPAPDAPTGVHLLVDTGVDDALALVAAAVQPALRLDEVTVCAGNVPLEAVIANTRFVLAAVAPYTGAVRVSRGAATRWDGRPFAPRSVHGPDGLGGLRAGDGSVDRVHDRLAPRPPRVPRAAGAVVCAAPQTTLTWLPPGSALVTYGREGQLNHALDPEAAREVARTWSVTCAAPAPPLALDEIEHVWEGLAPHDRCAALPRLVRALLCHQAGRGAGLGDADAVMRLAGSTDPLNDLVDALRR